MEAARKRGARILFCTRDYILEAARLRLKRAKSDLIDDARVRVDVTDLSQAEKDAILYNHIKEGDLSAEQKKGLKIYLPDLARLASFSPELARRLGSGRFHRELSRGWGSFKNFFDRPLHYLRDILHGLSESEMAALVVCLLNDNAVPDPVADASISQVVLNAYEASPTQVRKALETLEGSLVKRTSQPTRRIWQLHHPSMIEALQEEFAHRPSQIAIYLEGATLETLFRDTTTLEPAEGSRLVFVPDTAYLHLLQRMKSADRRWTESVATYLVERSSPAFLATVDVSSPEIIDQALGLVPVPDENDLAPRLSVRLANAGLLGLDRKEIVTETLHESLNESGWVGFLGVKGFRSVFPSLFREILEAEIAAYFPCTSTLDEWLRQDLRSAADFQTAYEIANTQQLNLREALAALGFPAEIIQAAFDVTQERMDRLRDEWDEAEAKELIWDNARDEDREDWDDTRWEPEEREERFADVDE